MIAEFAPAKVNLNLHVGPLRADGRHDLSSLIVFAGVGDVVRVEAADDLYFSVEGPFSAPLQGEDAASNLVVRAARKLAGLCGVKPKARITLEKRLPVASGVGGGSADAGAALRALVRLWGVAPDARALARLAFSLGADVPVCVASRPSIASGAGEILARARAPLAHMALVNPGVATPTGPIFRAYDRAFPTPPEPKTPPAPRSSVAAWRAFMDATRNDLQAPAIERAPVIADVLSALEQSPGAFAARMSGSGATCFALFSDARSAARAARRLAARGWWSASGPVLH